VKHWYIEAASGARPVRLNVRVCTHHFGDAAQALTDWARARHITNGHVTVLVIDPPQPCGALAGPPLNRHQAQAPGIAVHNHPAGQLNEDGPTPPCEESEQSEESPAGRTLVPAPAGLVEQNSRMHVRVKGGIVRHGS
jgi:hypothetical protein